MTLERVERAEGRELFGKQPGYDAARPDYPERVYTILSDRCGLGDGCRTLEVGAGSGQATRQLAARGARPIVAVEPDPSFGAALDRLATRTHGAVVPVRAPFESAEVEHGAFDLVVSATAFHWLDRETGARELGACLRSGGWLALFWNTFGDPRLPDPFHDATVFLLSRLAASPSHPPERALPFSLDRDARRADFVAAGCEADFRLEEIHWTLELDPKQVRALYATYSSIARLPDGEREALLEGLANVASREFGGRVERNMVTAVYTGRRA